MTPWLAIGLVLGVMLLLGIGVVGWALLAAASHAMDEWERVRDDD